MVVVSWKLHTQYTLPCIRLKKAYFLRKTQFWNYLDWTSFSGLGKRWVSELFWSSWRAYPMKNHVGSSTLRVVVERGGGKIFVMVACLFSFIVKLFCVIFFLHFAILCRMAKLLPGRLVELSWKGTGTDEHSCCLSWKNSYFLSFFFLWQSNKMN